MHLLRSGGTRHHQRLAPRAYSVFLKYDEVTACPVTRLNTVSPAERYPFANERIDDSGIWVVSGLRVRREQV